MVRCQVNGAEVVPAMVTMVRPLSWKSVCAVVAIRTGAVSLIMVVLGMGESLLYNFSHIKHL